MFACPPTWVDRLRGLSGTRADAVFCDAHEVRLDPYLLV